MGPWDALTWYDRDELVGYIKSYGCVDLGDGYDMLYSVMSQWDFHKRSLFHDVFGDKLRVRVPVRTSTQQAETSERLKRIYRVPYIGDKLKSISDYLECHKEDEVSNQFVHSVLRHIQGIQDDVPNIAPLCKADCIVLARVFTTMIKYQYVISNQIMTDRLEYKFFRDGEIHHVKVQSGSKTVKAIRTFLVNIGYDDMSMFDSWREAVSVATTIKERDVELVLSIHPIDYMTMSDNDCGWRSCMNWSGGEYSNGTIEMMNSDYVVVGYLESTEKPMMRRCGHDVPNKSWRCLFYVTPYMILGGKPYPYDNNDLVKAGVEALKKMTGKSYGGILSYDDMDWYYSNYDGMDMSSPWVIEHISESDEGWCFEDDNDYEDDECPYGSQDEFYEEQFERRVLVATGEFMYNDLFEDAGHSYWCVKATGIHGLHGIDVGGPCTCMCCGSVIYPDDVDECNKYCNDCSEKYACEDGILYPCEDLYEFELEGGDTVRMTKDMASEELWWRPYSEAFVMKSHADDVMDAAYVIEGEYDDGLRSLAHSSTQVFEDYLNSNDVNYKMANKYDAYMMLVNGGDCVSRDINQRHRRLFFVNDMKRFDEELVRFRTVEEVNFDDDEQRGRTVRV